MRASDHFAEAERLLTEAISYEDTEDAVRRDAVLAAAAQAHAVLSTSPFADPPAAYERWTPKSTIGQIEDELSAMKAAGLGRKDMLSVVDTVWSS